ncbi:MAG: hypothetical protein LBN10_07650, partial [Propionibacteriaceae bacterium]|nr:hypothetical protein [Propionibacteriaceae bacterium]
FASRYRCGSFQESSRQTYSEANRGFHPHGLTLTGSTPAELNQIKKATLWAALLIWWRWGVEPPSAFRENPSQDAKRSPYPCRRANHMPNKAQRTGPTH